jgi:hypothetical protein
MAHFTKLLWTPLIAVLGCSAVQTYALDEREKPISRDLFETALTKVCNASLDHFATIRGRALADSTYTATVTLPGAKSCHIKANPDPSKPTEKIYECLFASSRTLIPLLRQSFTKLVERVSKATGSEPEKVNTLFKSETSPGSGTFDGSVVALDAPYNTLVMISMEGLIDTWSIKLDIYETRF